jgi:hypothetical protein
MLSGTVSAGATVGINKAGIATVTDKIMLRMVPSIPPPGDNTTLSGPLEGENITDWGGSSMSRPRP